MIGVLFLLLPHPVVSKIMRQFVQMTWKTSSEGLLLSHYALI